jgi:hypothetical protein
MTLVSSFGELVQQVSGAMTQPTFSTFLMVLTGWVFARRRTVTNMILAAEAVGTKHHSAFHRLFATAAWSLDDLGLAVFRLILRRLADGAIPLALDDTLARKRGRKMYGVGMHHDPLISSRKTALKSWGHSWVILGVILKLPCCQGKYVCLPVLFRLYLSKQTVAKKGGWYRTRPELAVDLLHTLCRRYEDRRFHVVADSAYGGQSVLGHLPKNCDLTSRLPMDARLYEAPPPRKPGTHGRPRRRGRRLPTPQQMLATRATRLTLDLYGRHDKVRVAEGEARVYAVPERPLRVVAVDPLTGGRPLQAFYSTCSSASALEVLAGYARRWSMEEAIQNSKTHLGFEEPQGWARRAVERTAPLAMLLHSLIVLWFAAAGHRHYRVPHRPWYRAKTRASLADMVATLRRESIRERISLMPLHGADSRNLRKTLLHAAQLAA